LVEPEKEVLLTCCWTFARNDPDYLSFNKKLKIWFEIERWLPTSGVAVEQPLKMV
jgi:hypothetical protein